MRLLQLGLIMVFKATCKCGTGPVDDSYSAWRELLIGRVRTGSTQFQLHLPTAPGRNLCLQNRLPGPSDPAQQDTIATDKSIALNG